MAQLEEHVPVSTEDLNKSRIALGVAVVCMLFILETAVAHHHNPSPASPYIWAGLGVVALLALIFGVRCRLRSRQPPKA